MKTILRYALLIALLGSVLACSRVTQRNLDKIHTGMKTAQARSILGAPDKIDIVGAVGQSMVTWHYHSGKSEITLLFINDELLSKVGSLE
jgi:hypothetical protein